MKLLLDTHIWLWYRLGNPRLSILMHAPIYHAPSEWDIKYLESDIRAMLGDVV
ncbi:hypothetical protein [Microcoleus sp.]|uniref:hypothetical protein n=1 Tax=Microcoleus sp. TaxID=44472 RepID=UPI00352340C2